MNVPVTGSSSVKNTTPVSSVNGEVARGTSLWGHNSQGLSLAKRVSFYRHRLVMNVFFLWRRLCSTECSQTLHAPASAFWVMELITGLYYLYCMLPHRRQRGIVEIHIIERQQAQIEPSRGQAPAGKTNSVLGLTPSWEAADQTLNPVHREKTNKQTAKSRSRTPTSCWISLTLRKQTSYHSHQIPQ